MSMSDILNERYAYEVRRCCGRNV